MSTYFRGSSRKLNIYVSRPHPTNFDNPPRTKFANDNMESITSELATLLDKVPQPVLVGFGAIGLYFVSKKVLSFLNIFFSLFVLPGADVSPLLRLSTV